MGFDERVRKTLSAAHATVEESRELVAHSTGEHEARRAWHEEWDRLTHELGPDGLPFLVLCAQCGRYRHAHQWLELPTGIESMLHHGPWHGVSHGLCPDCATAALEKVPHSR